MGTPAFPNLGKHCSVDGCKLLDFLPFTCDCCNKVFCLEHRSYNAHQCPKADKNDRTVVICPLCAKGVHLVPDQDPNITWESHVNTDCDPSNYEKVTKKKKCPVPRCRETLTFSNTIKCRDCTIEHCLKHRLGPDHSCPGSKKPEPAFPFWGFSNSAKQDPPPAFTRGVVLFPKKDPPPRRATQAPVSSSSSSSGWTTSLLSAVSSLKASAEAGMAMLSIDQKDGVGPNSSSSSNGGGGRGQVEQCPICNMKFSKVAALIDHVQTIHEKKGVMKVTIDVCPKCSKGFRDPVALVEHVEREHRGMSKA